MRVWIKIVIILLIIISLSLASVYLFLNIKAKPLLTKKLQKIFNREVSIGGLYLSFPFDLRVSSVEIKGIAKIEELFLGGGLLDLLRSKTFRLGVFRMNRPVLTIEQSFIESLAEPFGVSSAVVEEGTQVKAEDNKMARPTFHPFYLIIFGEFLSPQFLLNHFIFQEGTINFIGKKIDKNNYLQIKFDHLNIKIDNLNISPKSSFTSNFELKGKIPWQDGQEEGKIEASGWLDLFKMDMRAVLKITDIDGIYFHPYYSKWVDLEKTRIEKAKLNLTSNIRSLNDDLTAESSLELTDIVFKPRPKEEGEDKAEKIAAAVLDIFRSFNQKIELNFTIKTKMSSPKFGFNDVKDAFENRLAEGLKKKQFTSEDILKFPTKLVGGTVKGATDLSKGLIDGTFSLAKELKEAVEYAFTREQKE